ncbi:MAG: arginine--tRNA ligase [Salibacteraceae bacterium]
MRIKQTISERVVYYLNSKFNADLTQENVQLEPTRKEFDGELTLVVFPFVRLMNCAPELAAKQIGEFLEHDVQEIEGVNIVKGFLNISLTAGYWGDVLKELLEDNPSFEDKPANGMVLVEFSSPNTNKPLHLGHLRNIFLGDAVSSLRDFAGDSVVRTQIINDRGVHICKSMLAWNRWGNGETPESSGLKGDKLVGKYYVIFDQKLREQVASLVKSGTDEEVAKKEAPLMVEVQEMLLKWEQGDPEVVALWKKLNDWVYDGFDQTYNRMRVKFDTLYYESETYLKGKEAVLKGLETNTFYKKEDNSVWCDLSDEGLDEKLLLRGDGTSVYMTQDIGTALQRFEDFPNLTKVVYTVGDEQDYHFKVLFKVLDKLGYEWASHCEHLSYGMVDLPSGKMKSREGTVVDADDLMSEVVDAAKKSSQEKGKLDELSETEQQNLYEQLGVGALKFYLLKVDPRKRMMFDPQESVSLNGDTGPFVQYTHARCKSVLRKAHDFSINTLPGTINAKERALLQTLNSFHEEMITAANTLNPALVASYCIEVAKLFNQFYHDNPILKAEGADRDFRLGLTQLTATTIKKAMALIGVEVPDQM